MRKEYTHRVDTRLHYWGTDTIPTFGMLQTFSEKESPNYWVRFLFSTVFWIWVSCKVAPILPVFGGLLLVVSTLRALAMCDTFTLTYKYLSIVGTIFTLAGLPVFFVRGLLTHAHRWWIAQGHKASEILINGDTVWNPQAFDFEEYLQAVEQAARRFRQAGLSPDRCAHIVAIPTDGEYTLPQTDEEQKTALGQMFVIRKWKQGQSPNYVPIGRDALAKKTNWSGPSHAICCVCGGGLKLQNSTDMRGLFQTLREQESKELGSNDTRGRLALVKKKLLPSKAESADL